MFYNEQNPPAVQNPYNYTDPDIRELAALIAAYSSGGSAGGAVLDKATGNFTDGISGINTLTLSNAAPTTGDYAAKVCFNFASYNITPADTYQIYAQNYFTSAPLLLEEGLIADILQLPLSNNTNAYTTRFFILPAGVNIYMVINTANNCPANKVDLYAYALNASTSGNTLEQLIARTNRTLYDIPSALNLAELTALCLQTQQNIETIATEIQNSVTYGNNGTQVQIIAAANEATLQTDINSFISSLSLSSRILNISYAIASTGTAKHQALVTYK